MPEHKPKLAEWDVADLQAAAYNPRKISRSRFEDLKRSMKADPDFLRIRPIIVNVNPERMGRRARLVELSAGYCDAIVARYVGHTKNAKLKLNGKDHEWKGPVITIEGVLDSLG